MSHAESQNKNNQEYRYCMTNYSVSDIFWEGDIEKTNFEQVIFSPCGRVFKKGVGWDGKSSWMIFNRKDGIFQWILSDEMDNVVSALQASESVVLNINSLWWNFYISEIEGGEEKTHIKIFVRESSSLGPWENVTYQCDLICEGGSLPTAVEESYDYGNHTPINNDFYKKAYPLRELPIYDGGNKTWEDHEGWTHCLEEPDWVESMLSYESSDDENRESTAEKKEERKEKKERQEIEEVKEELREDPFDGDLYTKKEFLDYYGTTLQWDFMSEEKTFKRGILGKWILENGSYMRPESTNYLLDKMIETFL